MSHGLDNTLKIVQLVFYATGATVAVLTYKSAKRGLLNSVNTEYHKEIIKNLVEISAELYSEFDEKSANYWSKVGSTEKWAQSMVRAARESWSYVVSPGFDPAETAFAGCADEDRMSRLAAKYKSNPFIPRDIKKSLITFLEGRRDAVHIANATATERMYRFLMAHKDEAIDTENAEMIVHNDVNSQLYEKGFGVSQVQETINELSVQIESYFEIFDPNRGGSSTGVRDLYNKCKAALNMPYADFRAMIFRK